MSRFEARKHVELVKHFTARKAGLKLTLSARVDSIAMSFKPGTLSYLHAESTESARLAASRGFHHAHQRRNALHINDVNFMSLPKTFPTATVRIRGHMFLHQIAGPDLIIRSGIIRFPPR